jgi:hypothetical protein
MSSNKERVVKLIIFNLRRTQMNKVKDSNVINIMNIEYIEDLIDDIESRYWQDKNRISKLGLFLTEKQLQRFKEKLIERVARQDNIDQHYIRLKKLQRKTA